jgi:class 3 adenylate cyclase
MPSLLLDYNRTPADEAKYGKGFSFNQLSKNDFDKFNPSILGLGNINVDGKYMQALAAFLDLGGFTDFCNQVDSHLVIPEFLSKYLKWLFEEISNIFMESEENGKVKIWGSLPFYAKFLGDGILFLWNTDYSGGFSGICNIVYRLFSIKEKYKLEFLPMISTNVINPPKSLRCGISRGQIISIGQGNDYVGSCINIASRLQKLGSLSFAFSRRGFDLESNPGHLLSQQSRLKRTTIRGIGENELVWINELEYSSLSESEKELFRDP